MVSTASTYTKTSRLPSSQLSVAGTKSKIESGPYRIGPTPPCPPLSDALLGHQSTLMSLSPSLAPHPVSTYISHSLSMLIQAHPILEYRPVRVRVIFKVPDSISPFYKHPLVYVDLFTKPPKSRENAIKMFKVQYERNQDKQIQLAVICLDWIQRSCFLLPIFGVSTPLGWRTWTILDLCSQYYMDDLLDIDSFISM